MTPRDDLLNAADAAVSACLPLLPLEGSDGAGYRLNGRVDFVLRATPEEWVDAAYAIATLHALLRGLA